MMRARVFVPAGTFSHDNGGDAKAPVQVYAAGSAPPGATEPMFRVKAPGGAIDTCGGSGTGTACSGADGADGCGPKQPPVHSRRSRIPADSACKIACFMKGTMEWQADKSGGR
jgi:hypothetical protein